MRTPVAWVAVAVIIGLAVAAIAQAAPPSSSQPAKKPARAESRLSLEQQLGASRDPLLRESAALVLGVRGSASALPPLKQALAKDSNKWVRARAAEALGLLGDPAAIPWLHTALAAEKDQRVRRSIGEALMRLGQSAGVKELVWQLQSGNNNTKAEVMLFLVGMTGQPLGQNADAWWDYFNERGGMVKLARRPTGSPALLPLRGVVAGVKGSPPAGPFLYTPRSFQWRQVPAVVLPLGPRRQPIDRAALLDYEKKRGKIPDGCLLLIRTDWRDVKLSATPRAQPASRVGGVKAPAPMRRPATEPPVPWLEPDAVAFLLARAPKLVGVGMDTPSLDPTTAEERPARQALLTAGRLAVESVSDLDRLVANGTRLILFPQAAPPAVTILALLP